jgi:tetratricopeptide (TPR) repeat protein
LGLLAFSCHEPSQTEVARGNILASQKKYSDAVSAYRKAAELAPQSARPRELLGSLLAELKSDAEARAAFEEAVKLEPDRAIDALLGLAKLDARQGKADDAIRRLSAVLQLQPSNVYALLSRANLTLRRGGKGDAEVALSDTSRALAIDSKSEAVLFARGSALLAAGKAEEAEEMLSLLAKKHPSSPLAAYARARMAALKGDSKQAIAELTRSRELTVAAGKEWRADEVAQDSAFKGLLADPTFTAAVKP